MSLELLKMEVGPWPMNTYLLMCKQTGSIAIVDPGADPEKILNKISELRNRLFITPSSDNAQHMILITHGHEDHIGALQQIRDKIDAPVYVHPRDAELFNIDYDHSIQNNAIIQLGEMTLKTIYTPGHTPGSICVDLTDLRMIVGDVVFVGGPGKSNSPVALRTTIETMRSIVFKWPDDTIFFPGHGQSGRIGDERPKFESFIAKGWSEDNFGDITW